MSELEPTKPVRDDRTVTVTFLVDDMRLIQPALDKTKMPLEYFVHIGTMKLAATWVLQTFSHIPVPDMVELQRIAMTEAKVAHWDDDLQLTFAEELMHLQSEVTEVFEAWRLYHDFAIHTDEPGGPQGVPIKFADIILGLFYNVALHNIDIVKALTAKHDYNLTRDYRKEGRQLHARPDPHISVTGLAEDDVLDAFEEAATAGAFQVQGDQDGPDGPVDPVQS